MVHTILFAAWTDDGGTLEEWMWERDVFESHRSVKPDRDQRFKSYWEGRRGG